MVYLCELVPMRINPPAIKIRLASITPIAVRKLIVSCAVGSNSLIAEKNIFHLLRNKRVDP